MGRFRARKWRRLTALILIMVISSGVSVAVAEELPEFSGDEFNQMFTEAPLENLAPIGQAPSITGIGSVDARIRTLGEARGYVRRPLPSGSLATVSGYPMQPDAAAAWRDLEAAARGAGHTLVLASAFRNHSSQVRVFLRRLTSYTDAAINNRLRTVAVPGYSKHHTGYAIDITQPGYAIHEFKNSPAYAWLIANNSENAKRHGWIPSYPADATNQGPEPEPWEWTYVGVVNIRCFGFVGQDGNTFCDDDGSVFEGDIEWMVTENVTSGCNAALGRFCPETAVTRGEMAAFLHRALGNVIEVGSDPAVFDDTVDSVFVEDVAWLSAAGITRGCGPVSFCPEDPVTRGQMAAFLVRALGLADPGKGDRFVDDDSSVFAADIDRLATAGITTGCNQPIGDQFCPEGLVTRGQMAAFLHRALN